MLIIKVGMRLLCFATLVVVVSAAKNGFSRNLDMKNQPPVQLPGNIPVVNRPFPEDVQTQDKVEVVPEVANGQTASSTSTAALPLLPPLPPPSASVPDVAAQDESSNLQSNAIDTTGPSGKYQPNWASIDSRPLPSWYDDAKIGIFIHWGVYSVPSFSSEWFWIDWKGKPSPNEHAKKRIEKFMKANYKPGFTYQDFAKDFTTEFFDPYQWANMIENAGAKYVVFTSKHHEGYALWPSKYSYSWNSVDVGPHRDLVGELRQAILKKKGIRFGLYHSLYEWFHPLYLSDKSNNFTTKDFVNHKIFQEMKELVNLYKPEVFWSDGEWEAPSEYWRSTEFLAWLYNLSPVKEKVVVNDRWGQDTLCKHGGMFTCQDRYNPGKLLQHKWENAMTIDKNSWGFNRMSNLEDYMTTQDLIDQLASTVSCGGNIVINVGPARDGTINPIFQDRLSGVGKWLKINGEAVYSSRPWDSCQNDTVTPDVWYTVNKDGTNLYAVMLRWPRTGILDLGCPELTAGSQVFLLDALNTPLEDMSGQCDTSLPEGFLHERLLETRNSPPLHQYAPPVTNLGSLIDFYKEPLHELFNASQPFYWKSTDVKKKSSSLKSSKSNNGEKKIVRFADVLGLDLADVHTFLDEIPRVPKSAFSDLKDKDAPALPKPVLSPSVQRKSYNTRADRNLVPLFVQPTSRPDFTDRLTRQKICLENAFVTNTNSLNIRGTVRVVNLDFHKEVIARLSKDRWRSHLDVTCSYLESCPDGGFSDRFTFIIPGDDLLPGCRLEIALKYRVSSTEYWDNNGGQNYGFHAVQQDPHRTADTMLSHPSTLALENWGSSTHSWAY